MLLSGWRLMLEQHGRFSVRRNHRIVRGGRLRHRADVTNAHGSIAHVLDDHVADVVLVVHLGVDQPEEQLVIAAQQARRIHDICLVGGVQNVLDGHVGPQHFGRVRSDLKLRFLPALDDDLSYAVDAV